MTVGLIGPSGSPSRVTCRGPNSSPPPGVSPISWTPGGNAAAGVDELRT